MRTLILFKKSALLFTLSLMTGNAIAHEDEGHVNEDAVGSEARVMHLATQHEEIGAAITLISQSLSDGSTEQSVMNYSIDLAIESDLGEWGQAFIYMIAAEGANVESKASSGVNSDFEAGIWDDGGFSDLRVAEAWVDIQVAARVNARIGKIDPTGIYDANEYANDQTSQFLAGVFVNNAAINFPAYTGGVSVGVDLNEHVTVNAGLFDSTGEFVGTLSDTFAIAEAAMGYHLMSDGNVRVSYWNDDATKSNGYALSVDQHVADAMAVFMRFGANEDDAANTTTVLSGGWQLEIHEDTLGLAYAQTSKSGADNEGHFELYYKKGFTEHFHITADVQQITNPGNDSANNNETVYGMRMQLEM